MDSHYHTGMSYLIYLCLKCKVSTVSQCISIAVRLEQTGETPVTVKKAMSMEMDFEYREMDAVHFYGRHNVERQMERTHLGHANWSVGSIRGTSSHHHNPFVILCDRNTEETYGNCYGWIPITTRVCPT